MIPTPRHSQSTSQQNRLNTLLNKRYPTPPIIHKNASEPKPQEFDNNSPSQNKKRIKIVSFVMTQPSAASYPIPPRPIQSCAVPYCAVLCSLPIPNLPNPVQNMYVFLRSPSRRRRKRQTTRFKKEQTKKKGSGIFSKLYGMY